MATSNAFQYVSGRLPGTSKVTSPSEVVDSYRNQGLGGLLAGTSAEVGPAGSTGAAFLGEEVTESSLTLDRRTAAVRSNSNRLMVSAQMMGQRRRKEEAQRQAEAVAQRERAAEQARVRVVQTSAYRPPSTKGGGKGQKWQPKQNQGPSISGRGKSGFVVGQAGSRIENMLRQFPGTRITETLGNRSNDQRNGVARRAQSYHYDSGDPAIDIGGPTAQLDAMYKELVRQGGWRQILWRVKGHYDHIHIA